MAEPNPPIALIMAGGSGTRFWPVSSPQKPKQFINLFGTQSLVQQTVERILPITDWDHLYLCTLESHLSLVKEQLPLAKKWILEPTGRNTAACLMLSVIELLKHHPANTPMLVFPADHYIADPQNLIRTLKIAIDFAQTQPSLITLGITPQSPHTGYGYIQAQGTDTVLPVKQFIEKPDEEKAKRLLREGNCFWNSGMFIWTLQSIANAFESFMPETWERLTAATSPETLKQAYHALDSVPVDKAILEKSDNVYVIPVNLQWSDVGSWNALYELQRSKENEILSLSGKVTAIDSKDCLVSAPTDLKIALVGVEDLIIVQHEDKLLIANRNQDQKIRQAAKELS